MRSVAPTNRAGTRWSLAASALFSHSLATSALFSHSLAASALFSHSLAASALFSHSLAASALFSHSLAASALFSHSLAASALFSHSLAASALFSHSLAASALFSYLLACVYVQLTHSWWMRLSHSAQTLYSSPNFFFRINSFWVMGETTYHCNDKLVQWMKNIQRSNNLSILDSYISHKHKMMNT